MKTAVVLCCLVAVAMAVREPEWENFKAKFGRKYKSLTEEAFRKKIFLNNKLTIDQHNRRFEAGESTFTLGVNQFADLTTEEYASMVNGYRHQGDLKVKNKLPKEPLPQALGDVDWRTYGCITPVKDQGQCGSCWSFSSTGSMEFARCHLRGILSTLSEQNLVDCTYSYGNGGCNGGWMVPCFQYVIANGGIDSEASYPYEAAGTSENCRYDPANSVAPITDYFEIPFGDEAALASALGFSVVSVAIDASHASFQLYSSGVYYEPLCDPNFLDHAVLVVGYVTDSNGGYWIVKNSWGTGWGQAGYIFMSRNKSNNCGIASAGSYPHP